MDPRRVRIYVEEADEIGRRRVEGAVSKVFATYQDFILAQASDDQITAIMGQEYRVEIQGVPMIRLRSVEFDTAKGAPSPPDALRTTGDVPKEEATYWIMQLTGPVKAQWGDEIRALGVLLRDYIPDNAFLVRMTMQAKERVEKLPFVTWVGLYEPVYKVSPLLMGRKGKIAPEELKDLSFNPKSFMVKRSGNVRVLIHDAADLEHVTQEVKRLGGAIIAAVKDTLRISIDISRLNGVAAMHEVKWMEPYAVQELHDDVAA